MKRGLIISFILASFMSISNAQWQETKGIPAHTTVWSLAVSNNKVYAGTENSGIFISSDHGANWSKINSININAGITDIAISQNKIVLATKRGCYISLDNGVSWAMAGIGILDTIVTSAIISGDSIFVGTSRTGVYLSPNNGVSWTAFNNGPIDLGSFTYSMAKQLNNIFVASMGGVYMWGDSGTNWHSFNIGLPYLQSQIEKVYVSDSNVYAAAYGMGLYSSKNKQNWTRIDNKILDSIEFSWYNSYSLEEPISSFIIRNDSIYLGTTDCSGLFFSSNRGKKWEIIDNGLPCSYEYAFALDNTFAYVGTDKGVYRRSLSDTTVTAIKEVSSSQPERYIIYPNPVKDIIKIEISGSNAIQRNLLFVSNIEGKIIFQKSFSSQLTEIDMSGFSKGVYILKIVNGLDVEIREIIKE